MKSLPPNRPANSTQFSFQSEEQDEQAQLGHVVVVIDKLIALKDASTATIDRDDGARGDESTIDSDAALNDLDRLDPRDGGDTPTPSDNGAMTHCPTKGCDQTGRSDHAVDIGRRCLRSHKDDTGTALSERGRFVGIATQHTNADPGRGRNPRCEL